MKNNRQVINDEDLDKVAGGDILFSYNGPTGIATLTSDEESAAGLVYETLPKQAENAYNCINDKSLNYMTDKERFEYMVSMGMIRLKV